MRALVIDDGAKKKIARVVSHADKNHYFPGKTKSAPGNDDRFVVKFGTYRAVFSMTHADGLVYRHLSVSVPGEKYPHPAAVWMIAHHFGFTGWDEDKPQDPGREWVAAINELEHCITVVQPVARDTHITSLQ